jgi:hypothetical protein
LVYPAPSAQSPKQQLFAHVTADRPTDYTSEIAAEICSQMVEGNSLIRICESENMPGKATVFGVEVYVLTNLIQPQQFIEHIQELSKRC